MKLQSIIQTLTGLFFVLNMNSQNMNIASGGNLTTSDGAEITVIGNLVVETGGVFELKNATLKVEGSSSGNIKYIKTLANSRWSGISSPVKNQNIKDFADVEIKKQKVSVQSYERLDKRAIVHWLPISMAKKAILTNLSPVLDYNELKKKLPKNVIPAHDSLTINL